MNVQLKIKEMSLQEKLMTMEALWDDLCNEDEVKSPDWHGGVLKKRIIEAKEPGSFLGWGAAKKEIRNSKFEIQKMKIEILQSAKQDLSNGAVFYENFEKG
jgi:hypothetical protein